MSSDLQFKGYALHDTNKYTEYEVIDFKPKTFGDYDIDIKINVCGICSSGVVAKVGPKVTEFKVGDRAGVGAQVCSCFECKPCKSDNENYCKKGGVDTYNAKYENGDIAHGGYSTGVRVHERFVFKLPDELKDEDAASMLCGGLTVYSPLVRYGVGPGKNIAVCGLGGLGHYAVQFAKALGADVTVFSHQADKEADAKKMGAKEFVLTTKKDFAKPYAFAFDFILSTVDDSAGLPITDFLPMLAVESHFHSVGLPDKPLPEFQAQALAGNGASISVTTWKELIPMKDVGKGIQGVKDNKVRYRYVMKVDI
ncbi:zinc-type alcohol dehydrogenase [Pseudohyphozyma bogoriensis]|nr:zinc-type alcohol dehydrogenase [Pseudohyphozyma bogoriensis]